MLCTHLQGSSQLSTLALAGETTVITVCTVHDLGLASIGTDLSTKDAAVAIGVLAGSMPGLQGLNVSGEVTSLRCRVMLASY